MKLRIPSSFPIAAAVVVLPVAAAAQASWSAVYPQQAPTPRSSPLLVHHEAAGRTQLLFGVGAAGLLNEAWDLQGSNWVQAAAPTLPIRQEAAIAYDALRQVVIVFGGFSQATLQSLDDTWEWDGVTWTQLSPVNYPSARQGAACAFDAARGRVVLFGGFGPGNVPLQDTWEWDGFTWTQRTNLPLSPSARGFGRMANEPVLGGMLLHGGVVVSGPSNVLLNDTWTFNGVTWAQRLPVTPPPFRIGAGMVADAGRQRIVLCGGTLSDPFTWEWNGTEWSVVANIGPGARHSVAMVYEAAQRRVVAHGGFIAPFGANIPVNDTWVYRTMQHADVAAFGAGCAGTLGVPVLANAPLSLPWLGDLCRSRVTNVPTGAFGAIFVASFQSIQPIPLDVYGAAGCSLLVAPDVSAINISTGNVADWLVPIPNNPALAGTTFRQQGFVFDFVANPFGLVASNGITLTTGVR
jgi:hypothetical protein